MGLRICCIALDITLWKKVVDNSCFGTSGSFQHNFYTWRWMAYVQLCASFVEILVFMTIGAGGTYYILKLMIQVKAIYTDSDDRI